MDARTIYPYFKFEFIAKLIGTDWMYFFVTIAVNMSFEKKRARNRYG